MDPNALILIIHRTIVAPSNSLSDIIYKKLYSTSILLSSRNNQEQIYVN
jgi:hypothetical protein